MSDPYATLLVETKKEVVKMTTVVKTKCSVEGCTYPYPEYVPHFNCLYPQGAIGHSKCHCTADACY